MVSTGSEEPATIVTKLRQALDAIGRLSSERAALEEALKVRVCTSQVEIGLRLLVTTRDLAGTTTHFSMVFPVSPKTFDALVSIVVVI